jgi:hypothetical protein
MIVRLDDFQKYTNVHSPNNDLQTGFLLSAEKVVSDYLGYNPVETLYDSRLNGNGSRTLQLRARPIRSVVHLKIDDKPQDTDTVYFDNTSEFITLKKGTFPEGFRNVSVSYVAGWANTAPAPPEPTDLWDGGHADSAFDEVIDGGHALNGSDADGIIMPKTIYLTIMRIAALLQSESDSNIGVTSKSFADSGTRTFMNFTNFDKYLVQLSAYKLVVI